MFQASNTDDDEYYERGVDGLRELQEQGFDGSGSFGRISTDETYVVITDLLLNQR